MKEREAVYEIQAPVSSFELPAEISTAVVRGSEIRDFRSEGMVVDQNQMKPLTGWALDEIFISRLVGEHAPAALQVLVDTSAMLLFDRNRRVYEGFVDITLLEDGPGLLVSRQLVEPVFMEISSGSGASIEPGRVMIDHTNLPSTQVRVLDRSPVNRVPVSFKTIFNPSGHHAFLRKESLIRIETPSRNIQGFGVESIPVTVVLVGEITNGPVMVSLVSDKGSIEPGNLALSGGQPGTVMFRSAGTGRAEFSASAAGFATENKSFHFIFPWMFLLFSFLGGLLGALVRYLMKKEKGKIWNMLALGLITGFVVAILYYVLGIQVINLKVSHSVNEFAVLGFGFIGALFWDAIYSGLSRLIVK